jgi:hypothetical protein
VLNSPADKSVAIRFFYYPPGDSLFLPLIFRVVAPDDPRLNTATISDAGRIAYISLSDMERLLPAVAHLPLLWHEAAKEEVLGSSTALPLSDDMEITVVSSHGTARAAVEPGRICKALGRLDSALKPPRALCEFQFFRKNNEPLIFTDERERVVASMDLR